MRLAVTDDNRVTALLCDTTDCTDTDVWLCPGGVIACDKHLPKQKG